MNGSRLTRCGALRRKPLPLAQRLVDEPHVALLEISQAAMDELGAAARGPAGEVVCLDQGGREAAAGGIEGDADTGDAAADDEHVEMLASQALQHQVAVERRLVHGHGAECRTGAGGAAPVRQAALQRLRRPHQLPGPRRSGVRTRFGTPAPPALRRPHYSEVRPVGTAGDSQRLRRRLQALRRPHEDGSGDCLWRRRNGGSIVPVAQLPGWGIHTCRFTTSIGGSWVLAGDWKRASSIRRTTMTQRWRSRCVRAAESASPASNTRWRHVRKQASGAAPPNENAAASSARGGARRKCTLR